MTLRLRHCLTVLFFLSVTLHAARYYVAPAPKGSDAATGAMDAPFATLEQGQTAAKPGDTVYLRGGTYFYKNTTAALGVNLEKDGSPGNPIRYWNYPGETPVFDFFGMTAQQRIKGVNVTGSWLHLKGIEMKGVPQTAALKAHESWCVYVNGGDNNVFEQLDLHHNMGPGLFIVAGGNNLVLNCDSHDNYDAYSFTNGVLDPGQNADGFGFHSNDPADSGTVFRGCRSWWNADDGWDFIQAASPVTVENCWAWNNGYKAGTTSGAGNGNGFKVGGYGLPPVNVPVKVPRHIVRFCLAFDNRAAGFYQNHHLTADVFYNNTAYNNKTANFNLLGYNGGDVSLGILRNNIAFTGTALDNATMGTGVDAADNSWNFTGATASDFQSVDTSGVAGTRQADGGLPVLKFMHLQSGSAFIDKGAKVGLPYQGSAPDLGAFEFGEPTDLIRPPRFNLANGTQAHTTETRPMVDPAGRRRKNVDPMRMPAFRISR